MRFMASTIRRSAPFRIAAVLGKALLWFVIVSVVWVVIYRFVPPPITATMVGDVVAGRGLDKDWMSLSDMDPDMARAAIAGEDGKFCSHDGFDREAIAEAFQRNQQGG